ncbi:hypothetical protein KXS82_24685, partial [Salmonella enterica subsp. enterica serovar Weltevreden]|nr:hypothetical protein [Salmonella enterica subsp. enterica serovar Weltevreden]
RSASRHPHGRKPEHRWSVTELLTSLPRVSAASTTQIHQATISYQVMRMTRSNNDLTNITWTRHIITGVKTDVD